MERYTLESKDKGIWALAYMFTPKGREETKHLLNDPNYHATHRIVKKFYVKKKPIPDAIDDGIDTLIHDSVSEASDIVQMKSNQRVPIQEIIKEFNDCIDRIEEMCPDDGVDYQESQESSSGSSSDVICC